MTSIVEFDSQAADGLRRTLGKDATILDDLSDLRQHLSAQPNEYAVVLGPSVDLAAAFELASQMRVSRPALGVIVVRRRVDSSILADALRAGVRDVINEDDLAGLATAANDAYKLWQAMNAQANPDLDMPGPGRGKVITVFAAKGGSGKTTMSTNIAAVLAEGGRSVALIDLDLAFGDVAIAMHLSPSRTIADAVRMEETLDAQAMSSLLTPHTSGVQVLVAPLDPSQAESINVSLVQQAINVLSHQFDYVVIDCPPALNDHVLAAFDESDLVTLLATLDVPSLKNLKLTLDTLNMLAFPADRLRVMLNRADSKVGLEVSDVQKTINMAVSAMVPSSVDVPSSTNRGLVLATEKPNHPASLAIRHYVHTAITGEAFVAAAQADVAPAQPEERRSRFGRKKNAA